MMNQGQVRIINPILTTYAQGYANQDFVGGFLFPRVPVMAAGGQILEFGKEAFKLYNTKRAPGGSTKRIQFGYQGKPFALLNDSVETPVPREYQRDAQNVPGIDLGQRATNTAMKTIMLSLEYDQALAATTASNYTSGVNYLDSSSTKWSTLSSGLSVTDPIAAIKLARETIRSNTGRYPNVAVFSAKDWNAFTNNTFVLDRIKYTERAVVTPDIASALLEIPIIKIGGAVYSDDAGTFSDIWGSNTILAQTELGTPTMELPSYGYTYTMDGHPIVEQPYWEGNAKSWMYGVTMERVPVLSGILAGYLIKGAS
jgi:hypothetical protein